MSQTLYEQGETHKLCQYISNTSLFLFICLMMQTLNDKMFLCILTNTTFVMAVFKTLNIEKPLFQRGSATVYLKY